ncbi:PREDICTED: cysteine-rich receptor-like protein kinase 25 isoform X2 [Tarenaya hassleriana]|uniref:cysteine-rich receptor-like protein kinase 25 isoform X2 n=1 Tax=Tarenaya hassleriana TaxID=28532 RepID=UPI00053C2463|nr:PREDICTED: cysteine-rich receptor-like protein kinase 25 isoform X2 [Tarenaya hassleriana]
MASCGFSSIVSCLVLICFRYLATQATDPAYILHFCPQVINFTSTNTYESNLITLLSNLSSSINSSYANGFRTSESGRGPDIVYGVFLCRGDMSMDNCRNCVRFAAKDILDRCDARKEAIVWYDECMLHYSNVNFFGSGETWPAMPYWNPNSSNNPNNMDFGSIGLIYTLIDRAQRSDKLYAADQLENASIERYGMVQCTRDIDANACGTCLNNLTNRIGDCCKGKVGWRVLGASCYLRYEKYPFFNGTFVKTQGTGATGKGKVRTTAVFATVPAVVLTFLIGLCCYFSYRRRRVRKDAMSSGEIKGKTHGPLLDGGIMDSENSNNDQGMNYVSLQTVIAATNGFSDDNKLGEGGFGPVYKGKLPSGMDVAIKRLSRKSSQGLTEFKNELILIIKLQHKNLVRLLGYCMEGDEKLLIYEFMPNKSLDAFLFDSHKCKELDWEKRMKIVHGTTKGLQYLHEDSRLKIIHRDLKAGNILLDDEMNPKISDFGTARIFQCKQVEDSTDRIVGTFGYRSPEYALGGMISEKLDIYSFGVLMLEIISGKKVTRFFHKGKKHSLVSYAWECWIETEGLNLVDEALEGSYSPTEVTRCVHVALLCTQDNPTERPAISQIAYMLSNDKELPQPKQPMFTYCNALRNDQHSTSEDVYSINEATLTAIQGR